MRPAHDIFGPAPKAIPGAIRGATSDAYWEPKVNAFVTTVQPGGFTVTRRGDLVLGTLLGSCVSACICDAQAGIGGLNHFLLPDDGGNAARATANATRYGVHAMEMLINEILKLGGARRQLQAKVFGGANVIALSSANPVGERNQAFTIDFLRREGIPVTAADLGGERARRVYFKPATNKVLVLVLDHSDDDRVCREEARLRRRAGAAPTSGGVELF
jgi:chemotaxis protein CheD